jgi:hypothetical protein
MPYDIIGDSNLIGDAVDDLLKGTDEGELQGYGGDILGAVQRGQFKMTKPNRLQRLALGIGLTTVAATSSAVVTVTPQVPFKLERFISDVLGLAVNDIKVGTVSQFVGAGSIPIEIFAHNAVGVGLKGDTAVPGVDIALYVSNGTAAPVVLSGAYLGIAAT